MKLTARKIRKIRSTLKRFDIYIDSTHKFDFMSLKPTRYVFAHDIDEAYWRFYSSYDKKRQPSSEVAMNWHENS